MEIRTLIHKLQGVVGFGPLMPLLKILRDANQLNYMPCVFLSGRDSYFQRLGMMCWIYFNNLLL